MAFCRDVDRLIHEISGRGHVPIVAGGGTLYLGALLRGIFPGPSADEALRQELSTRPLSVLFAELCAVDPKAAQKIHPNDRLRIVRALEVHSLTGRPISEHQQEAVGLPHRFVSFGLRRKREDHRTAIAARVDRMLTAGLIDEIDRLRAHGLTRECQAYRTIGVQEVFSFLNGEISRDELRAALISNTWALVRRQMAWFRNDKDVEWIDVTRRTPEAVASEILTRLPGDMIADYDGDHEAGTF